MKIKDLQLKTEVCQWQVKRVERLRIEEEFEDYTGLIHGIEMHVPYTKWDYAIDMCKTAKKYKGKKILVSGGDSVNLDMFSYFYRQNNNPASNLTPLQELSQLVKFLKYAETIYDKIVFIMSNHERRLNKFILRELGELKQAREALKLMKSLEDVFDDEGLNKIVFVDDFFIQIGDAIFSHFEKNSSVPGSVARWIVQYLTPRMEKEWSACYQFHTHCQLKMPVDRKVVIECGACVDSLDYWRKGKLAGKGKMSSIGYGRGEMDNGKLDLETADFVLKGWEGYL